jgi:hypothetical protein
VVLGMCSSLLFYVQFGLLPIFPSLFCFFFFKKKTKILINNSKHKNTQNTLTFISYQNTFSNKKQKAPYKRSQIYIVLT